jgi:agmatinase
MIGGEHTATLGAVRGLQRLHPGLVVMHVDAHTDLRDSYLGFEISHATFMRRVVEELGIGHLAQYGIRSGTREELELARGCLHSGPGLDVGRNARDRIHHRPVYVTIDIDVLDPSAAPGTGCPEPGGCTFRELVAFLRSLRELNVVGVDVMEVLPAADVNDITSAAAAKLVREAALAFGLRAPRA